ncbi:hypothetical protein ACFSNO_25380 [Streptomyces cirratus]
MSDLDDLTIGEAEALALLAADGTDGLVIVQDGRPVGLLPWDDLATRSRCGPTSRNGPAVGSR